MIKIIQRYGEICPLVTCDVCGDAISAWNEGAAVFNSGAPENVKVDVLHVHKEACQEIAEKRMPRAGRQELGFHLLWLCRNVEIDSRKLAELENLELGRR
jgi:hypothetical protein